MIRYPRLKRIFDLCLFLFSLPVFIPLFGALYALVLWRMGRPVLFRQVRPGLNEKPFTLYKFRTMTNERDADGKLLSDAMRLTPLGVSLRGTSLDEIPEFLNVVKGDMSFVGPRPLLIKYLPHYTTTERIRHTVRPGITGLAQVSGRNALCWDERLRLDVEYVRTMCFKLDVKIILKTVTKVLRSEDVSVDSSAIEPGLDQERSGRCIEN